MISPGPWRAAVFLACPVTGIIAGLPFGLAAVGGFYGVFLGGGAVMLLEKAAAHDERRRLRGGPLPDVLHQWIALRAAKFVYDDGWSRMAPHGLAGHGPQGNCTKVALHRGAAAALTMGLTRNPKIADDVTHAVGTWMAAHRMVPSGLAGTQPPRWNDQQMTKDNVIAVLLTAGGHHGAQPIEQALAQREQLLLSAGTTESAPDWVRRIRAAVSSARVPAAVNSRTTGGAR